MPRAALLAIAVALLPACSSQPMRELAEVFQPAHGQAVYASGLREYEEGNYAASARSFQAAIERGLPAAQRASAHKHLAFIHCTSNRERLCRDEFARALAIDPKLELTAAEAGHPVWGPQFRALKGETPLAAGLRQYEEGSYAESAKTLQRAIERGLPPKDRARAHKHLAFIHCASNREGQCRDEFRRALDQDPALQLTAAEAGHPAWGPVFRSLKGGGAPRAGEPLLLAGLRQYEEGDYAAAARSLEEAIARGLGGAEKARAHKHLGFIHCAAGRQGPCREEFRKALAAEPALELSSAEAGHPAWGPVFRAVKAGR